MPMPAPFDPVLASCLLAKAGVKGIDFLFISLVLMIRWLTRRNLGGRLVSPAELAARASPTSGNPRGRTADLRLDFKSPHSSGGGGGSLPPGTLPPQVLKEKKIKLYSLAGNLVFVFLFFFFPFCFMQIMYNINQKVSIVCHEEIEDLIEEFSVFKLTASFADP